MEGAVSLIGDQGKDSESSRFRNGAVYIHSTYYIRTWYIYVCMHACVVLPSCMRVHSMYVPYVLRTMLLSLFGSNLSDYVPWALYIRRAMVSFWKKLAWPM